MIDEYFGNLLLTAIVLAGFFVDWLAVGLNWQKLKPITKPLPMILLILWTILLAPNHGDWSLVLLMAAQIFGLIGDIFLLFPEKGFLFGLAAFLVGHFFYIGILLVTLIHQFQDGVEIVRVPIKVLLYLLTSGIILAFFYWVFKPLRDPDKVRPAMWAAIQVYGWVLAELVALTVFFTLLSQTQTLYQYSLPIGAFLFFISDSLLAYNKFIHPFYDAHLWIHMTYHLAQFSLAVGFLSMI